MTGLLRLLTSAEAPAARCAARDEFVRRFRDVMGYDLPLDDAARWWGTCD